MSASWITGAAEVAEVDRFLSHYLDAAGRPVVGALLRRAEQGLAVVRVFRGASGEPVASYVLYRLGVPIVTRLLAGALSSGQDLTDDDLTREAATGWYIAAVAAVAGHARSALTDLTAQTLGGGPLPLFARAATEGGRRLMASNGFAPLSPSSKIWWRPAAAAPTADPL